MDKKLKNTTVKIKVKVPATSGNLGCGFDVLGMALSLYNEIELEVDFKKEGLIIEVFGEGEKIIPKDKRNISFIAIKKYLEKIKKPVPFIKIKLKNKIPLAKGLGSSAATRIGSLSAINTIFNNKLNAKELLLLGSQLEGHSDNVVCSFLGGITISSFSNNGIYFRRLDLKKVYSEFKAIILIPEFSLYTQKAREVLPKKYSRSDVVFNISRVADFMRCLYERSYDALSLATQDKIHQPYRKRLIPGMEEVFDVALKRGAKAVFLSGAGPSILALAIEKERLISESMRKAFSKGGIKSKSLILNIDIKGVQLIR